MAKRSSPSAKEQKQRQAYAAATKIKDIDPDARTSALNFQKGRKAP